MDSIVLFLREGTLPREKGEGRRERQIKYEGKLLVFGCPRNKSCTNVRFLDSTSYVSILKQWSHS